MPLTSKQAKKRGRKGGRVKSEKKAAASAANGKLGGHPVVIQDEFTDRADLSKAMKHYWRKKAGRQESRHYRLESEGSTEMSS